jgi:flagellar M-ring protein FliF
MEWFNELTSRFREYYSGLHPRQRSMLVVICALVMTLTVALWGAAVYDPMVVLFNQPLDPKSTTEVLTYLETNGTPHRIESGTGRIYVPRSVRERASVQLRGSTALASSTSGMDIINNAPVGSTQFMERRRWTMALQSEIEIQINGFDQVLGSKVLLSIPEQALFTEDQVDPSASVYVELKPGTTLSNAEGKRIAALVAGAVPRLDLDAVEILDSALRVIHASSGGSTQYGISDELADLRRQYDRYFQRKIESMLERIVGPGKVVAQVSVELDHTERSVQQRELDGDKAVVISSRTREATSEGGSSAGVPGTTANIPEIAGAVTAGTSKASNEADEVANIDVPETRTQTNSLPGKILGVTASVVVDGTWKKVPAADGEEAASAELVYTARTVEELGEFKQIVAAAIGTDPKNVTIVNRPFAEIELTPAASGAAVVPSAAAGWIPWAVIGLTILLTFLFVVRPAVLKVTTPLVEESVKPLAAIAGPEKGDADGTGGGLVDQRPRERALSEWLESLALGDAYVSRVDVARLVQHDMEQSVYTLRSWLQQD